MAGTAGRSRDTGWLVLALVALVLLIPAPVEAARTVSEKRECATCHIAWMSDFKKSDVVTLVPYEPRPLEPSGRQDVVSTERMCFSCHDGFALDSRPNWLEGRHNHPVGVKPSDRVVLPKKAGKTVFPLNDDGKVYCGTCHSAHGLSWEQSDSPIFLRVPNVESSMCMTCHEKYVEEKQRVNHPVKKRLEQVPPRLAAVGGRFGKQNEIICQTCHTPHAARSKPLMVVDNRRAWLCSNCHADKAKVIGTKHDFGVMAPDAKNRKGEKVSEYGTCLGCHLVHDADPVVPLWGRETITSRDKVSGVCNSCHDRKGLARKKTIGGHSHPVNVPLSRLGIEVKQGQWHPAGSKEARLQPLPLFDENGRKAKDGTRVTCLTCHDPHTWSTDASRQPKDPRKAMKEEGTGQTSFLRIAQSDDSALCINCHVDKRSVLDTRHRLDAAKRDRLQRVAGGVGLLDQGACGSCHRAHNGRGVLMSPMARKKGQSAQQSICTTCHAKGGVAAKKQTGRNSHPLPRSLKRVGGKTRLPLFDDSGRRHRNGQMECATCHDPHRWSVSRGRTDPGREGNGRTSFLRLPAAPDSTLCVDCHRDKRFVRGTDHDLNVTAPRAGNAQGQTVRQSGVCGQCHSVHNAASRLVLWGRGRGTGGDPQEALCLGCHRQGEVAADKVPLRLRHPRQVVVWSNLARAPAPQRRRLPYVPVFDHRGRRAVAGRLSCASCHNPHVWDAGRPREGPGRNLEGDATNSFLRNDSSGNIVCADCHGADGLFRYKYFHGRTSRKAHFLYE